MNTDDEILEVLRHINRDQGRLLVYLTWLIFR